MPYLNRCQIMGHISREAEVMTSGSGLVYCNLSVAVTRRHKVGNDWKDETTWFRVTAFGKLAEKLKGVQKGTGIYAEGRLSIREWEKDGKKGKEVEIIADILVPLMKAGESISRESDDGDIPF